MRRWKSPTATGTEQGTGVTSKCAKATQLSSSWARSGTSSALSSGSCGEHAQLYKCLPSLAGLCVSAWQAGRSCCKQCPLSLSDHTIHWLSSGSAELLPALLPHCSRYWRVWHVSFGMMCRTDRHGMSGRATSTSDLLYVKEDLIIPSTISFYDLIVGRARGKSGPLFHFDVHDDIRAVNDASIEKDESHAGTTPPHSKVCCCSHTSCSFLTLYI